MVERIADMPAGTVGFKVTGEIHREDYRDVLVPELQGALERGEGLRTLYVIEDLEEIEPAALWADARLGFDLAVRHRSAFERSAIVTDLAWMARATRAFAWMIPGETRVFVRRDLEAAKSWVSEKPSRADRVYGPEEPAFDGAGGRPS